MGLTSLTDGAAKALASFKGEHLFINHLVRLSKKGQKALASFRTSMDATCEAEGDE